MALSLSNFISDVRRHGIHSTNSFIVDIKLPSKLTEVSTKRKGLLGTVDTTFQKLTNVSIDRQLSLRAHKAVMPGRNIMTKDDILRFGYGTRDKVGHNVRYDDVPVEFIVDNQHDITEVFDKWMELVASTSNDPYDENSCLVGYKSDYGSTIDIIQYNAKRQKTRHCTLYGAFPSKTSDIELAWGNIDQYEVLPVTFTYTYYEFK